MMDWNQLVKNFSRPYWSIELDQLDSYRGNYQTCKQQFDEYKNTTNSLLTSLQKENVEYKSLIKKIDDEEELEKLWNNKRPKTLTKTYPARAVFNSDFRYNIDPRTFLHQTNSLLPVYSGTNDEKAKQALKYVKSKIIYTTDDINFKQSEVWLYPYETLNLKKGDCEDGAILIANIMLNSGVPYWRIRLNAGNVKGGGHCWVTYLRETDNKWIILDWCYWYDSKVQNLNKLYEDAENYYDIWFSWNTKYIYLNEQFERV